jgi:histidinol-phosphatase
VVEAGRGADHEAEVRDRRPLSSRILANPDLAFAHELADLADSISLPRFRAADLRIDTKPDLTPVSDADRAVEEALRAAITERRPGEGFLGEEGGGEEADTRWVVDPIDGTRNFVRGIPIWATLVALERDGRSLVGAVSAPALGHRWWAARGAGAHRDESRLHVSAIHRIEDATFCYTSARDFARRGIVDRFLALAERSWVERGFGDFWMHMLVAEGAADAAVECGPYRWDMAVVEVIIEEAGGRFSGLDGRPHESGSPALSSNGLLHDAVVQAFLG